VRPALVSRKGGFVAGAVAFGEHPQTALPRSSMLIPGISLSEMMCLGTLFVILVTELHEYNL